MAAKYDLIARRANFYSRLKETENVGYLTPLLLSRSISNDEHNAVLQTAEDTSPVTSDPQRDLFDAA